MIGLPPSNVSVVLPAEEDAHYRWYGELSRRAMKLFLDDRARMPGAFKPHEKSLYDLSPRDIGWYEGRAAASIEPWVSLARKEAA